MAAPRPLILENPCPTELSTWRLMLNLFIGRFTGVSRPEPTTATKVKLQSLGHGQHHWLADRSGLWEPSMNDHQAALHVPSCSSISPFASARRAKPDSIPMHTTGAFWSRNGERALRKSETCFRISVALSARCSRADDADSSSALYPIPILACLDTIGTRLDAAFASDGLTDQASAHTSLPSLPKMSARRSGPRAARRHYCVTTGKCLTLSRRP
jgi:hypothetical protein